MSIADQVGMTVLHRAAEMGFIDTVKELLGPLSTQQKVEHNLPKRGTKELPSIWLQSKDM